MLQTKQLLSKKNLVHPSAIMGKSFASGSASQAAYSSLPKSSPIMGIQGKLQGIVSKVIPQFDGFANVIEQQTAAIKQNIDKISAKLGKENKPSITINNPQFTVSGVTGEEVTRKIQGEFEGLMLAAYQKVMK